MKKTFPLTDPKHAPPRVLDRIKAEVRKYLKRERRKALPEDADEWGFDCRVGSEGPGEVVSVKELSAAIDTAAAGGGSSVYVEILAKPARKPVKKSDSKAPPDSVSGQ